MRGGFEMIKITDRPKWADAPLPKTLTGTVLDLGCSYNPRNEISKSYFSLDINKDTYPNIIADADNIPLKSNAINNIICHSLLEHTRSPPEIIYECKRVMKSRGRIYIAMPFMYFEHDSCDYQRYSAAGLKHLLRDFKIITIEKISDGFFRTHIGWLLPLTYFFNKSIRKCFQQILHIIYILVNPIDIGKGRFYGGLYCVAEKR
jgi:SAM-dependent methyltransferase